MSRTTKETFRQRMQGFFGMRGPRGSNPGDGQFKKGEFFITPTLKKDLSRESPLNVRMKAINHLSALVGEKKLEDNGIEAIWVLISDLLDPQVNTDHRHLVLHFLKCIIIGQSEFLGPMRYHFFQVVKGHNIFEDLPQRLDMLRALSDNGKNLLDFEEEMGPFLMLWMPDVISYGKTAGFLQVLVNVIKYNSCYLDDHIIAGLVQHTCSICSRTEKERDIEQAIHVLDAVICYSCLPSESLYHFITALCRTVSVKRFCQSSWKLMRNLLGTHLGHSAIYTMCCIMEDSHNISDVVLLRGAVFFVGMARWGSMKVQSLRHINFTSVLPSFERALTCKHVLVAYEVTLSLQRLVKKNGQDIQAVTWDIILGIIEKLFRNIEEYAVSHEYLPTQLHDLLTMIERLYEKNSFNGSQQQLFAIVEEFARLRPDSSVLCLIRYRAQAIHPTKENWIPNLQKLLDRYFRSESRTVIREAALNVLSSTLHSSGSLYEDDLIKMVALPQLKSICDDRDPVVRKCAVKLLMDSAKVCQSPFCLDILDIIEKVVMKTMHVRSHVGGGGGVESHHTPPHSEEERDLVDVMTAVTGLLELFKVKMYRVPSSHAVFAFELLGTHMKQQYEHKYNSDMASNIRAKVFEFLLQLRADSMCRLGFPGERGIYKYSPYILCDSRLEMELAGKTSPPVCSSPPPGERHLKPTIIPFIQAFKMITTCLREETHWKVLSMVLPCLTKALQNKNLVLAANANMENLCVVLCSMVEDRSHMSRLQRSEGFNRIDFYTGIYSALTALVPYHTLLDQQKKVYLIKCFEAGLKLKCAQQCVDGLTLCVIEMQETMLKVLPSIILVMSQMSATATMAIPVLEFLSSLIWFPKLYANFVESEYMSIFAVALHYTNPFKFSLYVVSLAHHVIAMWFIKCRLPFRREFVNCITRGLQANALRPVPDFDGSSSPPIMKLRRSSSLTDRTKMNEKGKGKGEDGSSSKALTTEEALDMLNRLLTQTCLDMMARYTYSTLATYPKRSPVSEFLLAGGQSQSWLVGNKVVTVTTSGGSTRLQRNGVCERCNSLIQQYVETTSTASQEKVEGETESWMSKINEEKADQEAKQPSSPSGTGFGRLKRQRSKSGNTQRIDSSGNALQKKVTRTEDQEEVKHLTLFSSVTPEVTSSGLDTSRGSSAESLKGSDGSSSHHSKKEDGSHSARAGSKVMFAGDKFQGSKVNQSAAAAGTGSNKPTPKVMFSGVSDVSQGSKAASSASETSHGPSSEGWKASESQSGMSHSKKGESSHSSKAASKVMFALDTGHSSKTNQKEASTLASGSIKPTSKVQGGSDTNQGSKVNPTETGNGMAESGDQLTYKPRYSSRVSSASIYQCNCWCQGWAEIHVRRPTGNTSWIMRIQNGGALLPSSHEFPLADISALLLRNRDLDIDADMVIPDDSGSEDETCSLEEEEEEEEEEEDMHDGKQSISHRGLESDMDSLSFPRTEMGLSPMGPSFLQDYATMRKRELGEKRESAYCEVIKDLHEATDTLDKVGTSPKPGLLRSNSSPALISMGEPSNLPTLSPRSVARSFLEDAAQKPGSYKDPSFLSKRYAQDVPSELWSSPGIEKTDIGGDQEDGLLQTSGSSEFVDISYKDIENEESKATAKPASSTAPGDSTTDAVDVSAAISKTTKDQVEEHEPKAEKPKTLPVVPHLSEEESIQQSRKLLNYSSSRPRGHTVSIMVHRDRPKGQQGDSRSRRTSEAKHRGSFTQKDSYRSGINPSFVFLQVYFSPLFTEGAERPIAIPLSQVGQRAVKVLDRIPPYDTHKIGVVYVGESQANDETEILSNVYGSARYMNFLRGLGQLVSLKDIDPDEVYTGGLDRTGSDGNFTYCWQDDIMQVIFHIATLMPNKDSDPMCNGKKLHIGNDFVSIIYNESGQPYKLGTIKGQFNFAEIIVEPLDNDSNLVSIQAKPELEQMLGRRGPWMVSDQRAALLIRQMALHANLASQIHRSRPAEAYCSNWLERLRHIIRIQDKVRHMGAPSNPMMNVMSSRYLQTPEKKSSGHTKAAKISDFTDYA
ncbi:tuberin isoform X2 [Strongylocentrotus purpuratus]|uniref:Tuberin n=1 Tax=Strongylocentrotus purpuratus TaxID=7668 RepID=A0A7M7NPS1_STRPU|nr:tuberin isoform X2 [Strongylocentrotus purpuratus]